MYVKELMGPNIKPCGTSHIIFLNREEKQFIDT